MQILWRELPEKLAPAEFCPICGKTLTEAEHPALEVSRVDEKQTQSEIIGSAASENSIGRRQSVAILGALFLSVGVFLPIVSVPLWAVRIISTTDRATGQSSW